MHRVLISILLNVLFGSSVLAGEIHVDASAAPGGDGSAAKPFQTIAAALKAAQGGDTVTVHKGVYREAVSLSASGTPAQPTTLRAAPGERVILTGFEPIRDWKLEAGNVYTAIVDGSVSDLFVGLTPQPISRWPDPDRPMRSITEPNKDAGTFKDPAGLGDPMLKDVAATPGALMAFVYVARGNYFSTFQVKVLDPAAGTVSAEKTGDVARLNGKGDRYQFINHPRLITRPGQWAFESAGENKTRIHFRPASPADLEQTQIRRFGSRSLLRVAGAGGSHGNIANIRVEGLEVCGSTGKGVEVGGASEVTISRCIFHNNRSNGVGIRRCDHVQILHNLALANGNGIGVASSHDVLVQGNEVAFNMVDGVTVAGNVTGKPQGEPETFDITVRRNYIHHHLLLGHPDNVQTYRGVHRLTLEDNVLLWGGQGIMTEETEGGVIRNCAIVGTSAIAVIFGHNNSNNWTVENSTIGLGGWGAFSFTGKDYRLHDSIIWENPLTLPETLTSDHNVLWRAGAAAPIYIVSKPKWKRFATVAEAAALGKEQHSLRVDPQFRAAPVFQAPANWADENTSEYMKLRGSDFGTFVPGDKIEINGDGALRTVKEATADSIRFEPALPARPFRAALVWNWKNATLTALDLRPREGSPALTAGQGGKASGATLDIPAFVRGDFSGSGKREIPELPEDVKAALPNPNAIVLPVNGE